MGATIEYILDRLEQSSMFHLSLGSKELFHSNLLYWLSIIDWNAFLCVTRKFAGVTRFWWEDKYSRSENRIDNEIEVRREFHNFDLSIYIKVDQKFDNKEGNPSCISETWIPVFVLENKVKSLPRHDQLKEYTKKAIYDWRVKKKNEDIVKLWQEQPVTFVLLSLFEDNSLCLNYDFVYKFGRNKNKSILIKAEWKRFNYKDLHNILEKVDLHNSSPLNINILNDYCNFIQALNWLAENDWNISLDYRYVETIYPWAIFGYRGDKQVQLRIDDIRQKIHYAQMEVMLKNKLEKAGIVAVHAGANKDKEAEVTYNTNYAHNIGILEIAVRLDCNCSIFIQLQGHSYAHAFCFDKQDAASELNNRRSLYKDLFSFDDLPSKITKDYKRITKNYPLELQTDELYPKKWNSRAKGCLHDFKYFGKSFVYQNVLIPESVTIEHVLQAMVKDTQKCQNLIKNKLI